MQPTGNTYTPSQGLTPQGTQVSDLVNLLASGQQIASNPQQFQNANITPQQVMQPTIQADQMQINEPSYLNSLQSNLNQQAGIPQLQGQQQNLGQVFQMWLADQNLAQKYQGGQLNTPNSPIFNNPNLVPQGIVGSNVIGGTNPYLASPQSLVQAVTQPSGQGFQGFTDPNLITSAMTQVPNASSNMMSILQSAINSQGGLVNQSLGNEQTQYEGKINAITDIANILGGIYQNKMQLAQYNAQNPTMVSGSLAQAGSTFDSIVAQVQSQKAGNATERDVWDYINQHAQALKDQGVDVNELWALHKQMADKVGIGGLIAGGTKASSTKTAKAQTQQQAAIASLKGFGDFMNSYYSGSTDVGGVRILNPVGSQYNAQRDIYIQQLKKSLGASKAQQVTSAIQQNLPGEISIGGNADAAFKAHLQQVMDSVQVRLVTDKSGNVFVVDQADYNPSKDKEVNVNDLSIQQIQQILNSL